MSDKADDVKDIKAVAERYRLVVRKVIGGITSPLNELKLATEY